MAAYVQRKPDGSIAKGWILKPGTSINSAMCRPPSPERSREVIEEVPVDVILNGAGIGDETARGNLLADVPAAQVPHRRR